jgi:hypothetical protein
MKRNMNFVVILSAVAAISIISCHFLVTWLGIASTFGRHWEIGPKNDRPFIFLAGSSLAGDGLSWSRISDMLNVRIGGWGVAGSSTSEWEQFQHRATEAKMTVIVVSVYDLNENILCDFRAELVPFEQTVKDLWQSRADWPFIKRLLGTYPLSHIRAVFPTAGRSDGIMVGLREKFNSMLMKRPDYEPGAMPTLSFNNAVSIKDTREEKISDWPPGRMLRRLSGMRSSFQGRHAFNGPKKLAFLRMLHSAQEQGEVVVVVLPVSPAYENEFMTTEFKIEFENALAEAKRTVPQAHWIRLDQLDELNSNENFWDLVHMNMYGQKIATKVFLGLLKKQGQQL